MALQTVTVHLPDVLYEQVKERAHKTHRSIEEELVAVVAAALSTMDNLPADIADDMAQLAFLTTDELWRVAKTTLTPEESERMQTLLLKQQREGLTTKEEREINNLAHLYDRTMLLRSQAIALLKERGQDISNLKQPVST